MTLLKPPTGTTPSQARQKGFAAGLHKIAAIVQKDAIAELRTKEKFSAMFIFAILITFIFSIAFDFGPEKRPTATAGMLWVAFSFAAVLGLNRSFAQEKEDGCLEGLLLAPTRRSIIYLGKMTANLVSVIATEIIISPVFAVVLNIEAFSLPLLLVLFLGTFGFVVVGTLVSAMTANSKGRDELLPIILFPMVIPILIVAVRATGIVLGASPMEEVWGQVELLMLFDLSYLLVSTLIFGYAVEG